MPETYSYDVILERDEDGAFIVECTAFLACRAHGATEEEALHNIRDVIEMCLQKKLDKGHPAPTQNEMIGFRGVEVSI